MPRTATPNPTPTPRRSASTRAICTRVYGNWGTYFKLSVGSKRRLFVLTTRKSTGREEEVEENVYKDKKNVHENFTDYVFAESKTGRHRRRRRGKRCGQAGKVSGKWANTGLLGALDARLDDSAPLRSAPSSASWHKLC